MRLIIAAVGKMRGGPEAALMDEYAKRAGGLGRQIGFKGPDIVEVEAPKALAGAERQSAESKLLIEAAPRDAALYALDERGKPLSSEGLAEMLERQRDEGRGAAAFLIGGADGHDQSLRNAALTCFSFGAATWPHMLFRVMLAEQLYRAMTILAGHPYHRK